MKRKTIAIAAAVAAVLAAGLILASQLFSAGTYYYTQVDNSRIKRVHSNGGVIDLTGGAGVFLYADGLQGERRGGGRVVWYVAGAAGGRIPAPDGHVSAGRDRLERGGV